MVAWPSNSFVECNTLILSTFTSNGQPGQVDVEDSDDEEICFSSITGNALPSYKTGNVSSNSLQIILGHLKIAQNVQCYVKTKRLHFLDELSRS